MTGTVSTLGARLTTQGLLFSAGAADSKEVVDWNSVHDLSTLIHLFCLYDRLLVLDGVSELQPSGARSSILELVVTSGVLDIQPLSSLPAEALAAALKGHLRAYLGWEQPTTEPLRSLLVRVEDYQYRYETLSRCGVSNVPTAPERKSVIRSVKSAIEANDPFWSRAFLYLACSDLWQVPFAPDSARMTLIEQAVVAETSIRAMLVEKMQAGSEAVVEPAIPELSRVSPLAAVVFERAKRREDIAAQMDLLRSELAPIRRRIREAETDWRLGVGASPASAIEKWRRIGDELERAYGREPSVLSLNSILSFGEPVGEITESPTSAKSWINVLVGLPFDAMRRLLSRHSAIELHRLRRDRPGAARLQAAVENLFGVRHLPTFEPELPADTD